MYPRSYFFNLRKVQPAGIRGPIGASDSGELRGEKVGFVVVVVVGRYQAVLKPLGRHYRIRT